MIRKHYTKRKIGFCKIITNPLISSGKMKERKDMYESEIAKRIEDITKPIFARKLGIPKEGLSNTITPIKPTFKIFFRPNNYRLQIKVKTKTESTINYCKKVIPTLKINPNNKLIYIREGNIIIQYGKTKMTAIYSCPVIKGTKQGWTIEGNTIPQITHRINEIKQTIEKALDTTLNQYSRKFKVFLPLKRPVWERHEDFIKGESYIDKIPRECQFIDTAAKKVYMEKGIEFIGGKEEEPTLKVKTYLKNRAIEDIAPEISEAIRDVYGRFGAFITGMTPVLTQLTSINKEVTKLRMEVNRTKRTPKNHNKDLRKWI